MFQRGRSELDELVVECLVQPVVLVRGPMAGRTGRQVRDVEHRREVEPGRLPMLDGGCGVEHLGVADGLLE